MYLFNILSFYPFAPHRMWLVQRLHDVNSTMYSTLISLDTRPKCVFEYTLVIILSGFLNSTVVRLPFNSISDVLSDGCSIF